jgi:hypothetical protein
MSRMRWVVFAAIVIACASPPQRDERVTTIAPNDNGFKDVSVFLVHQCGSLDCHGSRFRSMRVYGSVGLRLAGNTPGDTSSSGREQLSQATPDEIRQSYLSVVGLEPEILSDVTRERGANPERLTLIRKARGAENHKGYNLAPPGSRGDTCLLSFLRGAVDSQTCQDAAELEASPCLSSSDKGSECAGIFRTSPKPSSSM